MKYQRKLSESFAFKPVWKSNHVTSLVALELLIFRGRVSSCKLLRETYPKRVVWHVVFCLIVFSFSDEPLFSKSGASNLVVPVAVSHLTSDHPNFSCIQPVESAQACVCQHSNTTILCKVCGQLMEGRIMKCPVHPKVFQLMGYSHCPRCHNSRLVQCGLPALTNSSTPSTPR